MGRGPIRPTIRPAPGHRLDEAFGLAVGARGVGSREDLADALRLAKCTERLRAVALGVVREHAFDADPEALEALDHAAQKAGRTGGALAGEHLGIGEPRAVIDGHEGPLPAGPLHAAAAIAVDAMPDARDPREFLRVDVHQRTRLGVLVAARRSLLGLDPPQLAQPNPLQDAGDRGGREPELGGDLYGRQPALATQVLDALYDPQRRLLGRAARPRGVVFQARRPLKAAQPLVDRLPAHAELGGGLPHGPSVLSDPADHQCPAVRIRPRVTM